MARYRRRRRRGSWRRFLLWAAAFTAVIGGLAGLAAYRELTADIPSIDQILHYQPPVATRVTADDGTVIGEFFIERRYLTPLERVPAVVRLAFLAAEDAHFYRHKGIDPLSVLRAMLVNLLHGRVVQGGSTITQQVVKSILLSPERSYRRKLREMILALRLERQLTKDQIFYLYLNHIYLGAGAYGVAAAAEQYFGKRIEDLDLAEAALLAGLPRAPSRYSPFRHPKRALARRAYVLRRMEQEGFITPAERKAAAAEPLRLATRHPPHYIAAPWYVEHVRRLLEERYGGAAPYQLGLTVKTAVDLRMQRAAEQALREGLEELERRQGFRGPLQHLRPREVEAFLASQAAAKPPHAGGTYRAVVRAVRRGTLLVRIGRARAVITGEGLVHAGRRLKARLFHPGDVISVEVRGHRKDGTLIVALDPRPQVEGALVAMDPFTGEVKAMVGGYDFSRSQFNRAVQALRQPGSAFKPFVYAAAFDRGFTPATVVLDAPIVLANGSQPPWMPRNYANRYYGPTTLRNALVHSLNAVTVRVAQDIGVDYLLRYLPRFGLGRIRQHNLSIALGSAEVTLLELVRAYGVFATGGMRFRPIFITRISDSAGNVLERARPHFERAISPVTAYLVTSLLQGVIDHGTGRRARILGRPAAGKTGTTNDTRDAWFVGYTPDLLAGVWVGFDAERSLGPNETGGRAAAPIWARFMKAALDDRPPLDFRIPKRVTFVQIDPRTGLRAAPGTPAVLECFRAGTEPKRYSTPAPVEDRDGTGYTQ